MGKLILWEDLTPEQVDAITYFRLNPPKYYKWFYKFYKKYIGNVIFFGILTVGALMIIFNDAIFNVVKGMFFALFGLVIWSASAYIYKHFYTKKYAKKIGLTMKQWNYLTDGMVLDI